MNEAASLTRQDNWAALRTLSLYRWSIAVLLLGLWWTDIAEVALPNLATAWLPMLCGLYLIACAILSLGLLFHWPFYRAQVYSHAGVDIALTTLLVLVSGGMESGLGVLMITPVAGLGTLIPQRMAALLAAIASLALLGEEIFRSLYSFTPDADYTMAGIIGVLMFIVTLGANTMSQRARQNALLAEQRGLDLANLSQLNERVIQHLAVGVLVLDEDDKVRMHNQAAARLLNVNNRNLARRPLKQIAPELAALVSEWRQKPATTLDGRVMEIAGQSLLPHFSRLSNPQGPALIFLEDAQRFDEQAQQVKLAALGRLTASIAHEIRNPLGAISHASQLIQQWKNSPEEEERLLNIIERHTDRIDQIIKNVLNLSRREKTTPQTFNLLDWLRQLGEEYQHAHLGQAIEINLERVAPDIRIRFDPSHLSQVISNLWENSVQHARDESGTIISLQAGYNRDSGRPYLEICDNGPGIPDDAADQVFEPFYTSLHQGTGLGLYIARELCECNNASIRLVTGRPGGACFRILFASNLEWAA